MECHEGSSRLGMPQPASEAAVDINSVLVNLKFPLLQYSVIIKKFCRAFLYAQKAIILCSYNPKIGPLH